VSAKLCFDGAAKHVARTGDALKIGYKYAWHAVAKQSFGDKRIPNQEIGNESTWASPTTHDENQAIYGGGKKKTIEG